LWVLRASVAPARASFNPRTSTDARDGEKLA
jgi:hypothetical protein